MTLAVSISATMCYSSLKFSKDFNAQKDRRQKAVSFYLGNDLNKSYQSFTCYLFSLELRSYYRPPEHNCLKPQLSNRNKSQIITTDVLGQVYNLQKLTLVAGLVPCSYPGLEPILRSSFGSLSLLKLNSSTWVNSPTRVATLFFRS